ncbi:MAG: ABC transporter ATP-binding protein [Chloroflexi bacterium]|nr:ABC transporter ATP-binding protein [Chloroflexota bacterium]MBI5291817.1 ABC transporter ATP-binding protein [Chloroflexota bacterium]
MPPLLSVRNLGLTYPNADGGLSALRDLTFDIAPGEFVAVVGPSGCGKSSLLQLLAGLRLPTAGSVLFEGEPLTGPRRRIGVVFQKANLMPWRTVLQNITLPLQLQGLPAAETQRRAVDLVELVSLTGFEHTLPRHLSGGMEQRVAIARALIHRPDLLLLDEPFGALDALTRDRMGLELLRIWDRYGKTIVMVTHSITEAVFLADRVLVFTPRPGQLRAHIPIPLPRPRALSQTYSPQFGALAMQVREAIE